MSLIDREFTALDYATAPFPHATKLGLQPVQVNGLYHDLYDIDEVEKVLGTRFAAFEKTLKSVYSVGHRTWPGDHTEQHKQNAEVHCIKCSDLEKFLAGV